MDSNMSFMTYCKIQRCLAPAAQLTKRVYPDTALWHSGSSPENSAMPGLLSPPDVVPLARTSPVPFLVPNVGSRCTSTARRLVPSLTASTRSIGQAHIANLCAAYPRRTFFPSPSTRILRSDSLIMFEPASGSQSIGVPTTGAPVHVPSRSRASRCHRGFLSVR